AENGVRLTLAGPQFIPAVHVDVVSILPDRSVGTPAHRAADIEHVLTPAAVIGAVAGVGRGRAVRHDGQSVAGIVAQASEAPFLPVAERIGVTARKLARYALELGRVAVIGVLEVLERKRRRLFSHRRTGHADLRSQDALLLQHRHEDAGSAL